jgi:hypothetical protein
MLKRDLRFHVRSVPATATFQMFSGHRPVSEPLSTMVLTFPDPAMRVLFQQYSPTARGRVETLAKLSACVASTPHLDAVAPAVAKLLDMSVIDFSAAARQQAIEIASVLAIRLSDAKRIGSHAGRLFPSVLLLLSDTNSAVADSARGLFRRFFPEADRQQAFISKLRRELVVRINAAVADELAGAEWDFGKSDACENWGRVCGGVLALVCRLIAATRDSGAKDLFATIAAMPVGDWMACCDGVFREWMIASARSHAYVYFALSAQLTAEKLKAYDLLKWLAAEKATVAQEKLLRLITVSLERDLAEGIDLAAIRDVLFGVIQCFGDAEKVKLEPFLRAVHADVAFVEKCLQKIAREKADFPNARKLFDCLFAVADGQLRRDFLIELLHHVLSAPVRSCLHACQLAHFTAIATEAEVDIILEKADPARAYAFLALASTSRRLQHWLKSRGKVSPVLLNAIIENEGTVVIRSTWPMLCDVPLEVVEDDWESLVVFIHAFVHSDELTYVIEKWPEILPALLNRWTGSFACFADGIRRDPETLVAMLLETDVDMVRYLLQIFPDDAAIWQLIFDFVSAALRDGTLLVQVFESIKPPPSLLDEVIFSDAIGQLSPDDALGKQLVIRIPQLALERTKDAIRLASAAVAICKQVGADPIEVAVSPIDAPVFCFEFWSRVGFGELNANDFCFLLQFWLADTQPWLSAAIYTRRTDWAAAIPRALAQRVQSDALQLLAIAQDNQLPLALAFICTTARFDFSAYPRLSGIALAAYPTIRPPDAALDIDRLARVVACEWNMSAPAYPDFQHGPLDFRLRSAVAYLQHFLPVVVEFDEFLALASAGIESGTDCFELFLALRIVGLLADTYRPIPVIAIVRAIATRALACGTVPEFVANEFKRAFWIGRFLSMEEFEQFANQIGQQFNACICPLLAANLVRLIAFFNMWHLIETRFAASLDLAAVGPWYLIANALAVMPSGRRTAFVTEDQAIAKLPQLFTALYADPEINRDALLVLFATFPTAAMSWAASPKATAAVRRFAALFGDSRTKTISSDIFKIVAESAAKLKLESTTITTEITNRRIHAVYLVDDASTPVKLTLAFPTNYPFAPVSVKCQFGDEGRNCAHQVDAAIRRGQSVDAGIIKWHQFITQRLVDAEPCTVCYSYLSEEAKKPTIACPTCHQKFHGKCLSKWFSTLLKPTCPYCSSAWENKRKK